MAKRKNKNLNEKKPISAEDEKVQIQKELVETIHMPIVFSWTTVDFIKKPVTEFYYVLAAISSMAMIGWGVYEKNFVTIVTFMLVVILVILALNEEPKKVDVKISEEGIDLNGEHYSYNEFRSFKVTHVDGELALVLKQRRSFTPFRNIYLEDQPVKDLEMFLGIYLEREEDEEDGGEGEAGESGKEEKKE